MRKGAVLCMTTILLTVTLYGILPGFTELGYETDNKEPKPLVGDWFIPSDLLDRERTKDGGIEPLQPGPGYFETSEYMMGSVAVGVILAESDGSLEPNTEDWSAGEITNVKNEIQEGLDWWPTVESDAMLSFDYNWTYTDSPIPYGREFIIHPEADHSTLIYEIMGLIGYTAGADASTRTRAYINDLRDAHGTDWAYAIFVAAGDDFPDVVAYAMLGGPYVVMSYGNDGWGITRMNNVTAHETGHIFWALDEYASSGCDAATDRTGYLNAPNPNCENGGTGLPNIMLDSTLIVRPGTKKQIGWNDSDGDNVMDILDVPPDTSLNPHFPDPDNNNTPTFTGIASVVAYPNNNPWWFNSGNSVTINKVADVEYRVDSGATVPWTSTVPTDGAFDEDIESYTFTTPPLPDGLHTFETRAKVVIPLSTPVTMYDTTPSVDTLVIDAGVPTSSVDALPMYTTSSTFTVNVTASDGPGGTGLNNVTLWYSKDGTPFQFYGSLTSSPWSFNFDASVSSGDGRYEFYSRAYDNATNLEDAPAGNDTWIFVDTEGPNSTVDALPTYSSTTFTITTTASDTGSGLQQVELWYDRNSTGFQLYGTDVAPPWSFDFDTTTTGGDGTYEFYSVAYDNAGWTELDPPIPDASTVIDSGLPNSSVEPLPTYTSTVSFTVNVTASDATSGVSNVTLWFNKDGVGHAQYDTDDVPPWSFDFDTSLTGGDGSYELYSRAYDNAGNHEDAPVVPPDASTMVDTMKPSSSVDALQVYTLTSTITVNATAIPDATGIQLVELWYSINGSGWSKHSPDDVTSPYAWSFDTLTTGGDGTYAFYSRAYDNANNYEDAPSGNDTVTFVDTQKPSSSVDPMTAYMITTSFTITIVTSDLMSGVSNVELWYEKDSGGYSLYGTDSAQPWSFDFDTSTTGGDGLYRFYSIAHDNAGWIEDAPLMNDTMTYVDTDPPSSSVDVLPLYTNAPSFTITLATTDNGSGIQKVELWYDKDGTGYVLYDTSITSPWSFSFDTSITTGDGMYEFYSRAYDNAGNYEDIPISPPDTVATVDTQDPDIQIIAPTSGEWLGHSYVIVDYLGSDTGSGIEYYEVKLDDGDWVNKSTDLRHTFTGLADGPHTLNVRTFDRATNNNTDTVSFFIDFTSPSLSITAPANNSKTSTSSVKVTWLASDFGSGIDHYEVKLDDGNYVEIGIASFYTFTQLENGTHRFTVKVVDNTGNENETAVNVQVGEVPDGDGDGDDDGNGDDGDDGDDGSDGDDGVDGEQTKGILELLLDYWWLLLLLIVMVVVISVVAVAVRRRKKRGGEEAEVVEEPPEASEDAEPPAEPEN